MPDNTDKKFWVRNKHHKIFGTDLSKREATKLADEVRRKGSSGSPDGDRTAVAEPQPTDPRVLAEAVRNTPPAAEPAQFVYGDDVTAARGAPPIVGGPWSPAAEAFMDKIGVPADQRPHLHRGTIEKLATATLADLAQTHVPAPAPAPTNGVAPELTDADVDDMIEEDAPLL